MFGKTRNNSTSGAEDWSFISDQFSFVEEKPTKKHYTKERVPKERVSKKHTHKTKKARPIFPDEITRENISEVAIHRYDTIKEATSKCLLLELPTGFGKTKVAIDLINHIDSLVHERDLYHGPLNILLLVAKKVHKQTWIDEINKWGGFTNIVNLTIECYESLKHYKNGYFDALVCDEIQHAQSETRLELIKTLTIKEAILGLSATIPRSLKSYFKYHYHAQIIKTTLQEAFDTDTLPEPKIYLIPLVLNDTSRDQEYVINANKDYPEVYCDYNERWAYKRRKNLVIHIRCTEKEYYSEISSDIEFYKNRFISTGNKGVKNIWLKLCGDRLKWLSYIKIPYTLQILSHFKNRRTLTFCNSIEQTEILGANCIHSKNKLSQEILDKFNNSKIKHITSCQMLNEGVNLTNCQVGIYSNLNNSEIITRQRFGRILRHKKPMVVIPYYIDTREQELVDKMISEYDNKLISTVGIKSLPK